MANPTLRTAGAWAASNATTQTKTLAAHQAGDMLILLVGFKHATMPTTVTVGDAGWAKLGDDASGTGASSNGGGDVEVAAFWKVAESAAETNPTITFNGGAVAATPSCALASTYQNGGLPWETPVWTSGAISVATNFSATMEAHVSATAGDLLIGAVVTNDNTTLTVPTFTQAGLTLSAVTETPATALSSTSSNDISADGCHRTVSSGTSSAAAVYTGTNSVADIGMAMMVRLRTGSYTGTAALTIPKPTLAGTGTVANPVTGSGGVTIAKPTLSASGSEGMTGTGAVTIAKPTLAGTGTETFTGSGGVTIQKPTLAGEGTHTDTGVTGSGGVTIAKPTLAATGAEAMSGSGGVTIAKPTLAGAGTETLTGSGGVVIQRPTLAGTGTHLQNVTGTAAITILAPSISATGTGGVVEDEPPPPLLTDLGRHGAREASGAASRKAQRQAAEQAAHNMRARQTLAVTMRAIHGLVD